MFPRGRGGLVPARMQKDGSSVENMEMCHEDAYRCSGLGLADRGADIYCAGKRPGVSVQFVIRLQRLLIERTSSDHKREIADRIVACEAAGPEPAALAMGALQRRSSAGLISKPSVAEKIAPHRRELNPKGLLPGLPIPPGVAPRSPVMMKQFSRDRFVSV